MQVIATVRSPFKQKFAIPRQPNLVPEAEGLLVFEPGFSDPNLLREIEQFSHVWLLFLFHETADLQWSATVQPPRLGGKQRVGVFASRAPYRPNPIGLSVVSNLGSNFDSGKLTLRVGGLDLLDGTPVLDIKPYLPYADALPQARGGFANERDTRALSVRFSEQADRQIAAMQQEYPTLRLLIGAVLKQDPRPAWRVREDDDKRYGMSLFDLNIKWRVCSTEAEVIAVCRAESDSVRTGDDSATAD